MTTADPPPLPVSLQGWPTCHDNLAWSEDELAVAVDEHLHILTTARPSKKVDSDPGHFPIETIRINQFTESEWPMLDLATLTNLSLGEEQSNSSVYGLAWSPVGVGIHKRSVLAVLTTNLLLSLWESTGEPGAWQRTCIVNKHLKTDADKMNRKNKRIRAFAWLPPLQSNPDDRKERQYLVTIDDENLITIFHIAGKNRLSIGNLEVDSVYNIDLPKEELPTSDKSPLQQLLKGSPVSRIKCSKWQKLMDENGDVMLFRLRLAFERSPARTRCADVVLTCEPSQDDLPIHGHAAPHLNQDLDSTELSPFEFKSALAQPLADFDQRLDLQGRVRVQHCGFARSTDGTKIATCVTFHPSDTVIIMPKESEQCLVVFASTGIDAIEAGSATINPRLELLRWIARHSDPELVKSDIDLRIMLVAAACVQMAFILDNNLMDWSRATNEFANNSAGTKGTNDEVTGLSHSTPTQTAERCEMCDSAISISRDLCSGRCTQGHTYARCGISFLAIQEPGISKYCSRCGKQFLNILKLEPQEGPSLSLSLFEQFDVCPYCRGKFRG